ncbi:hypothetical protein L0222_02485 [bacterium]|nr:hypothetical protein [bacterium]
MRYLRYFLCAIILVSVFSSTACKGQKATVVPKVQINKGSAEMGTPIEVTYSFATKPEFVALYKDMTVFVHFIDPKRIRRFQDDHQPPKPTREWRPNGNYNWTRTIFIPKNIPAGEYAVVVGIYSPSKGERMTLEGKPYGNRSYDMGTLLVEIPPQEPAMQYSSGWYDPETDPNDISTSWRWMKKEASVKARNPGGDSLLYLKIAGVPERFSGVQKLSVLVGEHEVETFTIETNMPVIKKYNIDKKVLGPAKQVEIKLAVNDTFTPALDKVSRDTRELGVRVYQVYLGKAID